MYHRRTAIFSGALALSSLLAVGAGAAAGASTAPRSPQASGTALAAARSEVGLNTGATSLHSASSSVDGKRETILANAQGLPLYYFKADTAKKSLVTGELARLWPALTGAKPTATGVAGKLTSLQNTSGRQVAYNGHFLYTFVADTPGHVTGQSVSGFFVATPGLKSLTSASKTHTQTPVVTQRSNYGY
jgi:predicted lipoprotein with Yx(FWY)xxD motif